MLEPFRISCAYYGTFLTYARGLVSLVRIPIDLTTSFDNNFFNSGMYDTLMVMIYQMLAIILAISLFFMVNRRLLVDLESDIVMRKQSEEALR